ncbi:sugar kinase [Gracilibacillus caseinilyticus]|uniref:Sugar kinase n=1 Tax=Gracilibacillus caseinilyticus TaxID=2932256 RepID=A0ABY4ERA2_9BACI|nr:sugar kinase [Gracilibacillus caseinilyticus]UOQ46723.1 sugar kinase [Gracilibacillus caseinilyticus]
MSKAIAAFGEVMMRMTVPGHDLVSQASTLHYSFSGTGVNVTGSLTKLGHQTTVISALPQTPIGDAAVAHLHKLGISTDEIVRTGNDIGFYFLENGFGDRPSRVTYSNRLVSSFNTTKIDQYDFIRLSMQIDVLHLCGIALAMNDTIRHQMIEFAQLVKHHGGMVVFDCNYRPALWKNNEPQKARIYYEQLLPLADIVIMNEQDAKSTLGYSSPYQTREEQLEDLIPKVAHHFSIPQIAGTLRTVHQYRTHSIKGYLYQNKTFYYDTHPHFMVLDRIGAGDAFTSGIIHGQLCNHNPDHVIQFATASCKLAHTITGDTPLATEEEILQAMRKTATDIIR